VTWSDPLGLTGEQGRRECGPGTAINRIGGGGVDNLRLKPQEEQLEPPGISVLLDASPEEAAQQMKAAFPRATGLHEQARAPISSSAGGKGGSFRSVA
jgi:hypothetical protein